MLSDVELIEPVKVEIKQINKQQTPYANSVTGRRETQNFIARDSSILIDAQVSFGNTENMPMYSQMGTEEQAKGYILVRYADISSVQLKRGDKITKLGQLDVNYFLLHSNGDPAAHFKSINGFTLVKLFFSDREPTK